MSIRIKTEIPGPRSRALMEERRRHVARGPFHSTPIFLERAQGAVLQDVDGNRFLDFASGIGVVNVGHSPPAVVDALRKQAENFLHAGFNVTPYESYVRLCERLNRAAPGEFSKKSFLANSGAEAVENAVKIARVHTGKPGIVCFEHAFHGRTFMAMGLTAKEKPYKAGFAPFPAPIYRAPFPYGYRWPTGGDTAKVVGEALASLEEVLHKNADIGAVIIEPVLGEGGFVPAPAEYLAKLSEICAREGILVIADEIQTGFGRTGTLFASTQLRFKPDVVVSAKGLGAGMPIAAVTGRAEIMDAPGEGAIGGTFGGNPMACAAALSVLDLFDDGKLLDHARGLGERIENRFGQWKEKFAVVGDARGLGPMRALELVKDRRSKEPNPEGTKKLTRYAYENGVVLITAGTYGNVIRCLVPLVMSEAQLDEGLAVIEKGLAEI